MARRPRRRRCGVSGNSSIEWTETTWNPVTGCTEASTGCANCYARGMSKRLRAMAEADEAKGRNPGKKAAYKLSVLDDGRWSGAVTPVPSVLAEPLTWKKPRRVFVNSMSDLFWGTDADLKVARQRGVKNPQPVPFEFIDQVFAVMALCPQHTFQVLTKRPERMAEYLATVEKAGSRLDIAEHLAHHAPVMEFRNQDGPVDMTPAEVLRESLRWPLPNAWLGTSVENQATADERIPHLLRCPAAVRWLSMEPLLGAVDWVHVRPVRNCEYADPADGCCTHPDAITPECHPWADCPKSATPGIAWVVIGGESGPNARPFNIAWARSIIEQCKAAGVPVFVKQLGAKPYPLSSCWRCGGEDLAPCDGIPGRHNPSICNRCESTCSRLPNKKGGDPAEWPEDLRVREYPALKGGADHA